MKKVSFVNTGFGGAGFGGAGFGVFWYALGTVGFWWALLYGIFWPVWLGFRVAEALHLGR